MQNMWEKARAEGRKEGRAEEAARAVLTVLQARGIDVPEATRERILTQTDPGRLTRWLKQAAVTQSIAVTGIRASIIDVYADTRGPAEAEQILIKLQHVLGKKASGAPEEQELVEKARAEGRKEGRAEEAGRAVLTVLRARGIDVPEAARERILAQKDPGCLTRWLKKAAVTRSLAEVLDEAS